MDRENRVKSELLKKMEAAVKDFMKMLGYHVEIQWQTSEENLQKEDIAYYNQIMEYIKTPAYKASCHEQAVLVNVSDELYFERSMKAILKKMCSTEGMPKYVTGISFYNVRTIAPEYEELKEQIAVLLEQSFREPFFGEPVKEEINVRAIIEERKNVLKEIFEKYQYIDVSDDFIQTLAILDDAVLKEILEVELITLQEQLKEEIMKPTRQNTTGFDVLPAMFYPYETKIGRLLFFYHNDARGRRYVLAGFEPKEKLREKYAMFEEKNGSNAVYIREEIPELIKNMLLDAKEEIIVVSPWISAGVEESKNHKSYYKELAQAAAKMPIHIYYGFDGSSTSTYQSLSRIKEDMADRKKITEANLKEFLQKISKEDRENVWCHYGYLHVKALIIDGKMMILGSNNMLSNVPRKAIHSVYEPFTQAETMMVTRDSLAIGAVMQYLRTVKGCHLEVE